MIILNSKNQIFIGQRFDKDKSAWQMPQGGIDKGESPAKAVIREMKEETGIKKNYWCKGHISNMTLDFFKNLVYEYRDIIELDDFLKKKFS